MLGLESLSGEALLSRVTTLKENAATKFAGIHDIGDVEADDLEFLIETFEFFRPEDQSKVDIDSMLTAAGVSIPSDDNRKLMKQIAYIGQYHGRDSSVPFVEFSQTCIDSPHQVFAQQVAVGYRIMRGHRPGTNMRPMTPQQLFMEAQLLRVHTNLRTFQPSPKSA